MADPFVASLLSKNDLRPSQEELVNLLRSDGPVKQAFERLCKAGCDEGSLESDLLTLHSLPLRSQRSYPAEEERKLKRIAKRLTKMGDELLNTTAEFILVKSICNGTLLMLPEVGTQLSRIGRFLDESLGDPKLRGFKSLAGGDALPVLAGNVKEATGKNHYSDVATLVGAVLGKIAFSVDDLKMYLQRAKRRQAGRKPKQ